MKQGNIPPDGMDKKGGSRPSPGIADYLAGEAGSFVGNLKPHLPQELVGGSLPYVPGTEDEAVWNASSQACGTEKVHYCYSINDGRVWYLACPSYVMASNPDSWCPLAAALPGNSEFWDRERVYIYEQEGMVTALRWDSDTGRMQVFLGASRTILPRVQSADTNFVNINAEMADIVPWKNRNLRTEKLSRATAKMLVVTGMLVGFICVIMLLYSFISYNSLDRKLADVKEQTQIASMQLVTEANKAIKSETAIHMVRIQEIMTFMATIDATLVKYEVKGKKVTWEALVDKAYVADVMGEFSSARTDLKNQAADGRVRVVGSR